MATFPFNKGLISTPNSPIEPHVTVIDLTLDTDDENNDLFSSAENKKIKLKNNPDALLIDLTEDEVVIRKKNTNFGSTITPTGNDMHHGITLGSSILEMDATCTYETDQTNNYKVFNYPVDSVYLITSDVVWDETQIKTSVANRLGIDESLIKVGDYVNIIGSINTASTCPKCLDVTSYSACLCGITAPTTSSDWTGKFNVNSEIKIEHVTNIKIPMPKTKKVLVDGDLISDVRSKTKKGRKRTDIKKKQTIEDLPELMKYPI